MTAPNTATVVDAIARVCAVAVDGYQYAAGVTDAVTSQEPLVVPISDDFGESGLPAVTVVMGQWDSKLQPGQERVHLTVLGTIWRSRVPLGEITAALYADRDALADAFIAHSKAWSHETAVQSAILTGGPGIRARSIPRGSGETARLYLTLPFTVDVVTMRTAVAQPS